MCDLLIARGDAVVCVDNLLTDAINIGNPNEFTISELADHVLAITESASSLVFEPLPSDDPLQRQPDITRARTELGREPTVQLAEGLAHTIDYFRSIGIGS